LAQFRQFLVLQTRVTESALIDISVLLENLWML